MLHDGQASESARPVKRIRQLNAKLVIVAHDDGTNPRNPYDQLAPEEHHSKIVQFCARIYLRMRSRPPSSACGHSQGRLPRREAGFRMAPAAVKGDAGSKSNLFRDIRAGGGGDLTGAEPAVRSEVVFRTNVPFVH